MLQGEVTGKVIGNEVGLSTGHGGANGAHDLKISKYVTEADSAYIVNC